MKVEKIIFPIALALFSSSTVFSDQVFLDDLIVDGSSCIGQDCVNGESFGFDTLRLKENNLRIKFDDTSNSASFPNNDWQLTANDSSNGGANKFSIDDISGGKTPFTVEAGAINNALYVDSSGDVGFGTNTPVVEVHAVDGNSPAMRLEQNGSSGFTPQTWDVAGNETNFFIRDVTNGSKLPFRIKPGSNDASIYISTDNHIGMGTTSPSENLDIRGSSSVRVGLTNSSFSNDGTNAATWFIASNGLFKVIAKEDGGVEMELDAAGNMTIGGSLIANGGANTFPDYVFEDEYDLKSLDEIDQYIEENGHLPGIPSAEEVAAQGGHNMTQLQLTLLEKVEELTLYTIAQSKLNEEQNQVIQFQENRIKDLEDKVSSLIELLK